MMHPSTNDVHIKRANEVGQNSGLHFRVLGIKEQAFAGEDVKGKCALGP